MPDSSSASSAEDPSAADDTVGAVGGTVGSGIIVVPDSSSASSAADDKPCLGTDVCGCVECITETEGEDVVADVAPEMMSPPPAARVAACAPRTPGPTSRALWPDDTGCDGGGALWSRRTLSGIGRTCAVDDAGMWCERQRERKREREKAL